MKHLYLLLLFLTLTFASPLTVLAKNQLVEARVVGVVEQVLEPESRNVESQRVKVVVLSGDLEGREYLVNQDKELLANNPFFETGDRVLLDIDGDSVVIVDFVRRPQLTALFLSFAILAIVVGGRRGAMSLLAMGVTFLIIFFMVLPMLLSGANPIFVALLASVFIIPLTFYLSHGVSIKTHSAVVGTLVTLFFVALLSSWSIDFTRLSGFASEEAAFLQGELGERINIKGLLLAGIIISLLGILDDITTAQASIVLELKRANKKLTSVDLFIRAMRVGRDHISSLVNTLILVFAGSSLPLLVLFTNSGQNFSVVLNYEMIADEIVRTLLGSIGLILAVPITTAVSAWAYGKFGTKIEDGDEHSHHGHHHH